MQRFNLVLALLLFVSLLNACKRDDVEPRVHVRRYVGKFEFKVRAYGNIYQGPIWDSTTTFISEIKKVNPHQVSIPYAKEDYTVEPTLDESGVLTDSMGYGGWFRGQFIGYDSVHFNLSQHRGLSSSAIWDVSGHRIK